ncbi:MAG: MraZ N-terminal domain containing protein [Candidatus Aenigmarchaeota archaeon]|nr:MraZ N-terminal domain containing protein [Candidatus Aenigmarchaeota archaeon]
MSKIDSKGRISIPISLRAKLNLLEGSIVSLGIQDSDLIIFTNNGKLSVSGTDKR